MKNNEYKCAVCGEIYEKGWSDEEAKEELKQNFGDYKEDDCAVVCDDCYQKMNIVYPFEEFKLKEDINKIFKEHNIEKEIDGFIIKDYDSLSKYMGYKMRESIEDYFSNMISSLADIKEITFGEKYEFKPEDLFKIPKNIT